MCMFFDSHVIYSLVRTSIIVRLFLLCLAAIFSFFLFCSLINSVEFSGYLTTHTRFSATPILL